MLRRARLARAAVRAAGPLVVSASPRDVFAAVEREVLTVDGAPGVPGTDRGGPQGARAAARLLLRWCAAQVTGRPPTAFEIVQRCAECGSTGHGRPFLAGFPDLYVSLAHRPGAVAAAVGRTPVAVDLELPDARRGVPDPVPDVLSPAELRQVGTAADPSATFLRLWVRKECLVKLGVATLDTLHEVDLAGAVGRPLAGGGTATRFGRLHLADWLDSRTGALVAAAGPRLPVRGSFPAAG